MAVRNIEKAAIALTVGFIFVTGINVADYKEKQSNTNKVKSFTPSNTIVYSPKISTFTPNITYSTIIGNNSCVDIAKYFADVSFADDNTQDSIAEETIEYASLDVPSNNDFYSYMDYRCITTGNQYELQQQAYTDSQGLRRVNDDVCVTMGSYYGTEIGTRFRITTTDNTYTVILGDCKADYHTDINNQYRLSGNGKKNIIEFIVDTNSLDSEVTLMGNVGMYENYSGEIIKIERIEE